MTTKEQFKLFEDVAEFIHEAAVDHDMTMHEMLILLASVTTYIFNVMDMPEDGIKYYCDKLKQAYNRNHEIEAEMDERVH